MNVSQYISNKIDGADAGSFTSSVTKIAIISIAMGLAVMVVSFAILEGFRNEIQNKIFSFGSHLQISKYDTNNSLEVEPIAGPRLVQELRRNPQVVSMQPFARKTAIIKTKDEVLGVVLKGIDEKSGKSPMRKNLVAGKFISFTDTAASNDILLSRKVADKLRLKPGDKALFYFIQTPPRVRQFTVRGIYQTGLDEFDEAYVIGDIGQVRQLNAWPDSLVGGMEVTLKDFNRLDPVADNIYENLRYDLKLDKITDQYAQLFDWLQLLNRNVVIFLILIIFVATFNMVATIFIMILERTNMIGVLKAIGATDNQIRSMFFFRGLSLTMRGMLYGNIIGLGFCAIQYFFHPIPLDPENYYMDRVPIHWDPFIIIVLNVATFLTSLLAVLIPTYLIARIKPVVAIKFD
ncbi:ABC transporter permease [Hymenobacter endophyticus]|uniref:FtsX-like permease family protein n=1 Tax=Hymenobacter endophyticus TaxID=3076335 RepID=A0ABU3TJT5_9BACT|nr:FtsX-like permease family protein [Hymenobacter endophyticus]MDU0371634.1 FtsX-like permease family protein [Hymenobacter endophyticus]